MAQDSLLPLDWTWTTLGNIAYAQSGVGFPKPFQGIFAGDYPLAKVSDISEAVKNNNGVIVKANNYLSSIDAKKIGAKIFPEGTTLFAKIGEAVRLNRRAINSIPILADNNVMGLIPIKEKILPRYLFYFMQSVDLYEYSQATTVPSVRKTDVEKIALLLPPLVEQERIIERIESLFTQLDAGVAGLKRAQAALKRYKSSVLKAACEGKLVSQDPFDEPEENILKRMGRTPLISVDLHELPRGWCWTKVGVLANKIQYGTSEKANIDVLGIPVLRMGNIQDGELDFRNLKYLPVDSKGIENLILETGDLIFNRTNSAELVGKTAIFRENHPKATFASYLIRVKLVHEVLPIFVSSYINSFYGRKYLSSVVSQQVGQANVNSTKLSNMPIPLPPLAEQYRIAAEVERRFSLLLELQQTIEANLKRAGRLRQAILKQAFEGKLS